MVQIAHHFFITICVTSNSGEIEVFMKLYAMKILDIGEEKLDNLFSVIDLDKRCKIEKFINKKGILIRTKFVEELGIRN